MSNLENYQTKLEKFDAIPAHQVATPSNIPVGTYVQEAVDKIRKFGRHVFWRNEARLIGYRSEYLFKRNRNRRNGKTLENKQEEPKAG